MNAFFKKPNPNQKVYLSRAGGWIQFTHVNHETGILIVSTQNIVDELREMAKNGVGGVVEIGQEEFRALDAKKNSLASLETMPRDHRESLSRATIEAAAREQREKTRQLQEVDPVKPAEPNTLRPVPVPPVPPRPVAIKRES